MRLAIGAMLLWSVVVGLTAANAAAVEVRCQPVVVPDCGNHLQMYFENGSVPNRCNKT